MSAKCDYCDQRATTLAGDTNGVLVCEGHVRLFAEREIAAAIDRAEGAEAEVERLRDALPAPVPSEADPETGDEPNIVQRIVNAWDCCGTCAGGVLASHDAATADRVRREVAEGIAAAIEARQTFAHGNNPTSEAHVLGFGTMRRLAARIAREAGR
jgi:hypothetical protein